MEKVNWGILSTARVARLRVVPAMMAARHCEVRAIASRDPERARAAAGDLGIPTAYGSYEELLADPQIEAVYIAVPNHLHVPLTVQAVAAGKHVLCEKPVGTSAADAEALRAVADRRLVMEGFMVRWHPRWQRVAELVRDGAIGDVRAIHLAATFHNDDPGNIRNRADAGGGALLDVGGYAVVLAAMVFGDVPRRAIALIDRDPAFGTDRLASGIVEFGAGRRLVFSCSTQLAFHQEAAILGTRGTIALDSPIVAGYGGQTVLKIQEGSAAGAETARQEVIPPCNHFALQADGFSEAVRGVRTLPWGVDDAIANMRALDALYRSEATGTWEDVPTGS